MSECLEKPKKSRCRNCKKKCSLIMQLECSACLLLYCVSCRDMKVHKCPKYDEYISNKRKAHELELEKNKTVASKRLSV